MLEVLRIRNYALIDDLEVEFGDGFNILTGETGAGKSIIVGALNLVLGGRASSESVRQGARQAKVDAVFRIPRPSRRLRELMRQHDLPLDGDELILSRAVTAEGRSRAYVAGGLVPVAVLSDVGDELVDIHGQHEHQSLLKHDRQLDLLDCFAGTEKLAEDVATQVDHLRDLDKAISELESDDRERARRVEFLKYEVGEIDAAGLEPGEEDRLRARRNLITHAERIFSLASHARDVLYEGDELPAAVTLDGALTDLGELASIDARFQPLADQLGTVRVTVEEVASELRNLTETLEFDPQELDRVNERLTLLSDLKRKYGDTEAAILEYRNKAALEVETYAARDERLETLRAEKSALLAQLDAEARDLSGKRRAAARRLDKQVTAALQELGMKGGGFQTAFEQAGISRNGIDRVEFLLSANPGEKLKPLRQIASGGEVSRIMLALKAVFALADAIPTLIFDEIDAGVGGQVARNVARKLAQLAASHQTICVTHIAQIAAAATHHFCVRKHVAAGRTITTVARVESAARVEEVARLLDGSVSEASLKHARTLLET